LGLSSWFASDSNGADSRARQQLIVLDLHIVMCEGCRMLEQYRTRIRAVLAQPGMNKMVLAHQAGVHRNTLSDLHLASWNPQASTLAAIMDAVERLEKKP
jgi:lambda repressor-like predicted transcriptional regulator